MIYEFHIRGLLNVEFFLYIDKTWYEKFKFVLLILRCIGKKVSLNIEKKILKIKIHVITIEVTFNIFKRNKLIVNF